jgi:hypothetical protein
MSPGVSEIFCRIETTSNPYVFAGTAVTVVAVGVAEAPPPAACPIAIPQLRSNTAQNFPAILFS